MAIEVLKDDPEAVILREEISRKYILFTSSLAIFGIGLWMALAPDGMRHSSVEKSSVYIVKEIWSLEVGFFLLLLGVVLLAYELMVILKMRGPVWKRSETGHFYFEDQKRVYGLASLKNGSEMIVFNTPKSQVLSFENYDTVKKGKYNKPKVTAKFSNSGNYWNADESGYAVVISGVNLRNMSSKFEGDDLIVTDKDTDKIYLLKNYKSSLDNNIRAVDSM